MDEVQEELQRAEVALENPRDLHQTREDHHGKSLSHVQRRVLGH